MHLSALNEETYFKKLPTWGRRVSKIWKNCRRRLWMVLHNFPYYIIGRIFEITFNESEAAVETSTETDWIEDFRFLELA